MRVIGAFLGRSFDFAFFGAADLVSDVAVEGEVVAAVALLFCASPSRKLTSEDSSFLCHGVAGGQVVCSEMLVSGVPLFLGGERGTSGSRVCGR